MYREPLWLAAYLEGALEKEKEKYVKCPVMPDRIPDYTAAQGWGFVVTGYFLVEQSFKAILHTQGETNVPSIHSLTSLFTKLSDNNKSTLREYYIDFKHTAGNAMKAFPIDSLDDFLVRLDGRENRQGTDKIGSIDWRYFLIEENNSQNLPLVSVDYLHEIACACIRIIECEASSVQCDPTKHTYSNRIRSERMKKYLHWLDVRSNSDGWDPSDERVEILYGPDGLGNYDLYHFKNGSVSFCISKKTKYPDIRVDDKREEIQPMMSKKDFEV